MYSGSHAQESISDLLIDSATLGTPSEDESRAYWRGRSVFISSVMTGLGAERSGAIDAVTKKAARVLAWETIVPAPVKAEDAWLAGVDMADALVLVLGSRYGARRDDGRSATHAEFDRAVERGIPRWVFVDARTDGQRDAPLENWIRDDIMRRHSYATFDSPEALAARIAAKMDDTAALAVFTWIKFGRAILRAESTSIEAPESPSLGSGPSGRLEVRGAISDPATRDYLENARRDRRTERLIIDGHLFDARLDSFIAKTDRGRSGYEASFALSTFRPDSGALLDVTYNAAGQTWTADDIARISLERLLGSTEVPPPLHWAVPEPIDWDAVVTVAGGMPELVQVLAALLVTERVVGHAIFARVHLVEAHIVGLPRAIELRVLGSRPAPYGVPSHQVEVAVRVRLGNRQ
jgi:hypothetical protein